jgi:UDP-glucose 4-epimerase
VTGGAGFIGSHTVDLLLANNYAVTVLDNLSSGKLNQLQLFHPNLQFIQGSILDYALLAAEVKKCDAVIHLAAISSVAKSILDPITSMQVNTNGFVCVLQAIRAAGKPIRLVYASSAAVYGNEAALPNSDELGLNSIPASPYALDKSNNERYAALYAKLFALPALGLRYFNVYGPRQDPQSPYAGVIAKFIQQYQQDAELIIFGDGTQSRDFISVKEVAQANLLAIQNDYAGIMNIATGRAESLLALVSYIEKVGQKSAKINFAPAQFGDIMHSYGTITQAKQYLKFTATMPLSEGINSLLNDNKSH